MLGLLAILAAGSGDACRPGCCKCCCNNRDLPTFVPVRGMGEFMGAEPEVFNLTDLADEGLAALSATAIMPLNVFTNLKNAVPVSEGLQITRNGIYELSFSADVLFSELGADMAAYVQHNGTTDLFFLTSVEWQAGTGLQTVFNTARVNLLAGDELRLAVSVLETGTLLVEPGAKLSVKRVG